MNRPFSFAAFAALLVSLLAGCSKAPAPKAEAAGPVKRYSMEGEVMRLEEGQVAVIKHKDIEGWMKAMTMEYPVRDQAEYRKLRVGRQIHATVNVRGYDYWVSDIR